MKMFKKWTSLLLTVLMLLALFALPVFAEETTTEAAATDAASAEEKLPDPIEIDWENAFQGKTLYLAGLDGGNGFAKWEPVIKAFETLTGATVEATFEKNIAEVIRPQIQSGNGPDVIYMSVGGEGGLTETMIKEKMVADLEDVLAYKLPGEDKMVAEKLIPGFTDTFITNPYDDGKTYLAPLFYSPCGLFYNKANFGEGKLALPATWDEFFALKDQAPEGASLFTYPTAGYFDAFFYALVNEVGGPELFNKMMNFDVEAWQSEEATKAFELIGKLKDVLEPNTVSQANGELFTKNQQAVIDNKALFLPNGTWLPGEMAEAPKTEGFDWGFMSLPAMEKDGDRYAYTYFEQCFIPADAAEADLARAFVAFLYSDEAVKLFAEAKDAEGKPAPALQPVLDADQFIAEDDALNKMVYTIYDNGTKAAMGAFAAAPSVEGLDLTSGDGILFATINSVMNGDKTVEEWQAAVVDGVQKIADAIAAEKK